MLNLKHNVNKAVIRQSECEKESCREIVTINSDSEENINTKSWSTVVEKIKSMYDKSLLPLLPW